MTKLAVVINTTDKYASIWEGFWYHFSRNWTANYPIYFLNERKDVNFPVKQIKVDIPEMSLWTKKLRESIKQIPEDDVLVWLEDLFLVKKFREGEFENIYRMFKRLNADALRIRMNRDQFTKKRNTSFIVNGLRVKKLKQDSKYLVYHSVNIWKKSYLLECLEVDETPWENERYGSIRMQNKKRLIYIIIKPGCWVNVCNKGKVVPGCENLLKSGIYNNDIPAIDTIYPGKQ